MPRESLASRVYSTEGALSATKVCVMILQVTLALQHLHEASIVHNYVSARSIYDVGNKLILGDFIYAQNVSEGGKEISSIAAQLPWMAPAQVSGAIPDSSSDIYRYAYLPCITLKIYIDF